MAQVKDEKERLEKELEWQRAQVKGKDGECEELKRTIANL